MEIRGKNVFLKKNLKRLKEIQKDKWEGKI
jgi:hypothetical protein